MLTCKDFLRELGDYLDEILEPEERRRLEEHINACPNCWVLADTTKRTIQVYQNCEAHELPNGVRERLMMALEKKLASKGQPPPKDLS